jgi:hypothetical protein
LQGDTGFPERRARPFWVHSALLMREPLVLFGITGLLRAPKPQNAGS